jgi:hypothetical protein
MGGCLEYAVALEKKGLNSARVRRKLNDGTFHNRNGVTRGMKTLVTAAGDDTAEGNAGSANTRGFETDIQLETIRPFKAFQRGPTLIRRRSRWAVRSKTSAAEPLQPGGVGFELLLTFVDASRLAVSIP